MVVDEELVEWSIGIEEGCSVGGREADPAVAPAGLIKDGGELVVVIFEVVVQRAAEAGEVLCALLALADTAC